MKSKAEAVFLYRLTGFPLRKKHADLPPREIDLSHIPLPDLQRIFHAGPANTLLERRYVNDEKAGILESYCSESIDTRAYRWEFSGRLLDES